MNQTLNHVNKGEDIWEHEAGINANFICLLKTLTMPCRIQFCRLHDPNLCGHFGQLFFETEHGFLMEHLLGHGIESKFTTKKPHSYSESPAAFLYRNF